ncbi:MAG: sulfite exporter TauE/SafE family protein [Rubrobacter sp.]|nr:sulfite exporter TauE/SafE family protein [Rubrobacter sp.]
MGVLDHPAPVLFGLLVGFLVGLTGVGGGSLMTPFLISGMGVSAPIAVGTDLVQATLTKLTGSVQHHRQRSVNMEVAIFMWLGSIPASLLGVATLEWIKASFDAAAVQSIMKEIIAITLVLTGVSLIVRVFLPSGWIKRRQKQEAWKGETSMSRKRRLGTVLLGATGGYLVGLTSIGSGSVMAVLLLLFYPLSPAVIVGTDIVHAMVLSFVTGFAQILAGNVDFGLAGMLLLGTIPGVLVGSRLSTWVPAHPLRVVLAATITFVGVNLLGLI